MNHRVSHLAYLSTRRMLVYCITLFDTAARNEMLIGILDSSVTQPVIT